MESSSTGAPVCIDDTAAGQLGLAAMSTDELVVAGIYIAVQGHYIDQDLAVAVRAVGVIKRFVAVFDKLLRIGIDMCLAGNLGGAADGADITLAGSM